MMQSIVWLAVGCGLTSGRHHQLPLYGPITALGARGVVMRRNVTFVTPIDSAQMRWPRMRATRRTQPPRILNDVQLGRVNRNITSGRLASRLLDWLLPSWMDYEYQFPFLYNLDLRVRVLVRVQNSVIQVKFWIPAPNIVLASHRSFQPRHSLSAQIFLALIYENSACRGVSVHNMLKLKEVDAMSRKAWPPTAWPRWNFGPVLRASLIWSVTAIVSVIWVYTIVKFVCMSHFSLHSLKDLTTYIFSKPPRCEEGFGILLYKATWCEKVFSIRPKLHTLQTIVIQTSIIKSALNR